MENEKLLSEEKYQENNKKVKKIGKILLITGIILLVLSFIITAIGLIGFGGVFTKGAEMVESGDMDISTPAKGMFGSFGLLALSGTVNGLGLFLTIAGIVTLIVAHRREIAAYTTQQVMPVAKEGIEKVTPTVANSAKSIAKSISEGIQESKNEENTPEELEEKKEETKKDDIEEI